MRLVLVAFVVVSAPLAPAAAAPQPIPYSEARRSSDAYECRYRLPSIGGYSDYVAQVRGDDVHALMILPPFTPPVSVGFAGQAREAQIHWWRISATQYIWRKADAMAIRFDLDALRAATGPGGAEMESDAFLYPNPSPDAVCTAIPHADLALPAQVDFRDETQGMVEEIRARAAQAAPPSGPRRAQLRSANPP